MERDDIVRRALDLLETKYREVIVLRDFEERTWEEIASLLGESPSAVAQRYSKYALPKLREILTRMLTEEECGGCE